MRPEKKGAAPPVGKKIMAVNRKARFNYEVLETFQVGVALLGTEVKAIRQGRANISEANAGIRNGEVFLYNCHVSEYSHGNINNHDPLRIKKLLMHKFQIRKLIGQVKEQGITLIPLNLYFQKGKIKIDLALAKGKQMHDKREDIKKKEATREIAQNMKRSHREG